MADDNGAPNLNPDKVKAFQKGAFGSTKDDEKPASQGEGVIAAMKRRLLGQKPTDSQGS